MGVCICVRVGRAFCVFRMDSCSERMAVPSVLSFRVDGCSEFLVVPNELAWTPVIVVELEPQWLPNRPTTSNKSINNLFKFDLEAL